MTNGVVSECVRRFLRQKTEQIGLIFKRNVLFVFDTLSTPFQDGDFYSDSTTQFAEQFWNMNIFDIDRSILLKKVETKNYMRRSKTRKSRINPVIINTCKKKTPYSLFSVIKSITDNGNSHAERT